jgi:cupin 2 domain-containing protein
MKCQNLFGPVLEAGEREVFEPLIQSVHFKLERIVSRGQATPPGVWYDQPRDEWVALLKGSAGLLFEGETEALVMGPGECLLIPCHRRHRVEWTDPNGETIWLALHYDGVRENRDEARL